MAPGPHDDFAAAIRARYPAFRATGTRLPARKSEVMTGELDGRAVVAKRLASRSDVWRWYFAREIEIYRGREDDDHGVAMPRFVTADEQRGILLIERIRGEPLARVRDARAALASPVVEALLASCRALASSARAWPAIPQTPRVRSAMRSRFLEDPSAPVAWIRDGVQRCARRGLLARPVAAAVIRAIDAHPDVAACHGDLLLRNVIADGERVVLVDWECAGLHLADWDRALLWTQLAGASRARVEGDVQTTAARWRCFLGLVAFALAREISFAIAFRVRDDHPALVRRRAELVVVGARLTA